MADLMKILLGVAPVLALAFVMPWLVKRNRAALAYVLTLLRERGGMTLNEVCAELKVPFWQKGYVMNALDEIVGEGSLRKEPPPEATARMQIFKLTKYAPV